MGAVHGVYLKYVGLGLIAGGVAYRMGDRSTPAGYALTYAAVCNLAIAVMFKLRKGMWLLGKDAADGSVPLWSYLVWIGFHLPTWLYTYVHTRLGNMGGVPVASEVADGWYIGGCYSHELGLDWSGVLDLTCEFPETAIGSTKSYKLVAVWDGTPPTPAQIDEAARFCAEARSGGRVLVHCAHGRGRSTCCMVAALAKAGVYASWEEAFKACKEKRPVVKLNSKMRKALSEWEAQYQKRD